MILKKFRLINSLLIHISDRYKNRLSVDKVSNRSNINSLYRFKNYLRVLEPFLIQTKVNTLWQSLIVVVFIVIRIVVDDFKLLIFLFII